MDIISLIPIKYYASLVHLVNINQQLGPQVVTHVPRVSILQVVLDLVSSVILANTRIKGIKLAVSTAQRGNLNHQVAPQVVQIARRERTLLQV